jgi:hypothetical protein
MTILNQQLFELVKTYLDKELYTNATFYAERLITETECDEYKYYLAKAYIGTFKILSLGDGKYHKAYSVLKDLKSNNCRYLFAEVCIKLNKLSEAERALLTDNYYTKKSVISKEVVSVIPNGASGYYLLGLICEKLVRGVF